MKNPFKQLLTEGKNTDETEADKYLTRALVPVLTATGVTPMTITVLECGTTPDDIWGFLIGIDTKKLTALESARVKQLVNELRTFDTDLQNPA